MKYLLNLIVISISVAYRSILRLLHQLALAASPIVNVILVHTMTMSRKPLVGSGDPSETMSLIGCGNKRKTTSSITASTSTVIKKKRVYRKRKHIHHDLIMEQILTKVPVKDLLRCVTVSKSWYNSIHNDKRLT